MAVIKLLTAQAESCPGPTQVVRPLELFLTGMEQPQAESLLRCEPELQRATPMEHPKGPSHVIGSIAERLTRPVSGNL